MISFMERRRSTFQFKCVSLFLCLTFTTSLITPPQSYAQNISIFNLPAPGAMVNPSPGFLPPIIRGLTIHPDNPLQFDFLVDKGQTPLDQNAFKEESRKLIKYFLASLTVSDDDQWVNLSPYEKDRIIPDNFGQTEMGRDLLAQDYLLKQLTASLIYPEDDLGKKFWDKVYKKAYERFGTTDIPVDTFNKVWIVPDRAVVYEHGYTAFVADSHLKVMLEEDYLALAANTKDEGRRTKDEESSVVLAERSSVVHRKMTSELIKQIILPEIEREVNEGKNFAQLRQIYNSMILATWFKQNLKQSLLGQVYVDQSKIKGIDLEDKNVKDKIYAQYLAAYKKGVYNYIREEFDANTKQAIPRKYFSGGFDQAMLTTVMVSTPNKHIAFADPAVLGRGDDIATVGIQLIENLAQSPDEAMAGTALEMANSILQSLEKNQDEITQLAESGDTKKQKTAQALEDLKTTLSKFLAGDQTSKELSAGLRQFVDSIDPIAIQMSGIRQSRRGLSLNETAALAPLDLIERELRFGQRPKRPETDYHRPQPLIARLKLRGRATSLIDQIRRELGQQSEQGEPGGESTVAKTDEAMAGAALEIANSILVSIQEKEVEPLNHWHIKIDLAVTQLKGTLQALLEEGPQDETISQLQGFIDKVDAIDVPQRRVEAPLMDMTKIHDPDYIVLSPDPRLITEYIPLFREIIKLQGRVEELVLQLQRESTESASKATEESTATRTDLSGEVKRESNLTKTDEALLVQDVEALSAKVRFLRDLPQKAFAGLQNRIEIRRHLIFFNTNLYLLQTQLVKFLGYDRDAMLDTQLLELENALSTFRKKLKDGTEEDKDVFQTMDILRKHLESYNYDFDDFLAAISVIEMMSRGIRTRIPRTVIDSAAPDEAMLTDLRESIITRIQEVEPNDAREALSRVLLEIQRHDPWLRRLVLPLLSLRADSDLSAKVYRSILYIGAGIIDAQKSKDITKGRLKIVSSKYPNASFREEISEAAIDIHKSTGITKEDLEIASDKQVSLALTFDSEKLWPIRRKTALKKLAKEEIIPVLEEILAEMPSEAMEESTGAKTDEAMATEIIADAVGFGTDLQTALEKVLARAQHMYKRSIGHEESIKVYVDGKYRGIPSLETPEKRKKAAKRLMAHLKSYSLEKANWDKAKAAAQRFNVGINTHFPNIGINSVETADAAMLTTQKDINSLEDTLGQAQGLHELSKILSDLYASLTGTRTRIAYAETQARREDDEQLRAQSEKEKVTLLSIRDRLRSLIFVTIDKLKEISDAEDKVHLNLDRPSLLRIENRFDKINLEDPDALPQLHRDLFILKAGRNALMAELEALRNIYARGELATGFEVLKSTRPDEYENLKARQELIPQLIQQGEDLLKSVTDEAMVTTYSIEEIIDIKNGILVTAVDMALRNARELNENRQTFPPNPMVYLFINDAFERGYTADTERQKSTAEELTVDILSKIEGAYGQEEEPVRVILSVAGDRVQIFFVPAAKNAARVTTTYVDPEEARRVLIQRNETLVKRVQESRLLDDIGQLNQVVQAQNTLFSPQSDHEAVSAARSVTRDAFLEWDVVPFEDFKLAPELVRLIAAQTVLLNPEGLEDLTDLARNTTRIGLFIETASPAEVLSFNFVVARIIAAQTMLLSPESFEDFMLESARDLVQRALSMPDVMVLPAYQLVRSIAEQTKSLIGGDAAMVSVTVATKKFLALLNDLDPLIQKALLEERYRLRFGKILLELRQALETFVSKKDLVFEDTMRLLEALKAYWKYREKMPIDAPIALSEEALENHTQEIDRILAEFGFPMDRLNTFISLLPEALVNMSVRETALSDRDVMEEALRFVTSKDWRLGDTVLYVQYDPETDEVLIRQRPSGIIVAEFPAGEKNAVTTLATHFTFSEAFPEWLTFEEILQKLDGWLVPDEHKTRSLLTDLQEFPGRYESGDGLFPFNGQPEELSSVTAVAADSASLAQEQRELLETAFGQLKNKWTEVSGGLKLTRSGGWHEASIQDELRLMRGELAFLAIVLNREGEIIPGDKRRSWEDSARAFHERILEEKPFVEEELGKIQARLNNGESADASYGRINPWAEEGTPVVPTLGKAKTDTQNRLRYVEALIQAAKSTQKFLPQAADAAMATPRDDDAFAESEGWEWPEELKRSGYRVRATLSSESVRALIKKFDEDLAYDIAIVMRIEDLGMRKIELAKIIHENLILLSQEGLETYDVQLEQALFDFMIRGKTARYALNAFLGLQFSQLENDERLDEAFNSLTESELTVTYQTKDRKLWGAGYDKVKTEVKLSVKYRASDAKILLSIPVEDKEKSEQSIAEIAIENMGPIRLMFAIEHALDGTPYTFTDDSRATLHAIIEALIDESAGQPVAPVDPKPAKDDQALVAELRNRVDELFDAVSDELMRAPDMENPPLPILFYRGALEAVSDELPKFLDRGNRIRFIDVVTLAKAIEEFRVKITDGGPFILNGTEYPIDGFQSEDRVKLLSDAGFPANLVKLRQAVKRIKSFQLSRSNRKDPRIIKDIRLRTDALFSVIESEYWPAVNVRPTYYREVNFYIKILSDAQEGLSRFLKRPPGITVNDILKLFETVEKFHQLLTYGGPFDYSGETRDTPGFDSEDMKKRLQQLEIPGRIRNMQDKVRRINNFFAQTLIQPRAAQADSAMVTELKAMAMNFLTVSDPEISHGEKLTLDLVPLAYQKVLSSLKTALFDFLQLEIDDITHDDVEDLRTAINEFRDQMVGGTIRGAGLELSVKDMQEHAAGIDAFIHDTPLEPAIAQNGPGMVADLKKVVRTLLEEVESQLNLAPEGGLSQAQSDYVDLLVDIRMKLRGVLQKPNNAVTYGDVLDLKIMTEVFLTYLGPVFTNPDFSSEEENIRSKNLALVNFIILNGPSTIQGDPAMAAGDDEELIAMFEEQIAEGETLIAEHKELIADNERQIAAGQDVFGLRSAVERQRAAIAEIEANIAKARAAVVKLRAGSLRTDPAMAALEDQREILRQESQKLERIAKRLKDKSLNRSELVDLQERLQAILGGLRTLDIKNGAFTRKALLDLEALLGDIYSAFEIERWSLIRARDKKKDDREFSTRLKTLLKHIARLNTHSRNRLKSMTKFQSTDRDRRKFIIWEEQDKKGEDITVVEMTWPGMAEPLRASLIGRHYTRRMQAGSDKPTKVFVSPELFNEMDKKHILHEFSNSFDWRHRIEILASKPRVKDPAMAGEARAQELKSTSAQDRVGGIDFNAANLDLQIKRDGNGVPLPLNLQPLETMNIEGFVPVIINIAPVQNLPLLLGLLEKGLGDDTAEGGSPNQPFVPSAYFEEQRKVRELELSKI